MRQFWIKYKDNIFRVIEVLCYVLIAVAMIICVKIFLWERQIHFLGKGYVADAEVLGSFGDFMAGTIGCVIAVISMYLLFRTLKSQRSATISNNELMTIQRFNDLFFRLIDLYKQLSDDLVILESEVLRVCSGTSFTNNVERRGKDFFDKWRFVIMNCVQPAKTFGEINQQSLEYYLNFYNKNNNKLGAYFRTLYRILELIDESEISDVEKRKYSKILRAQLCESELFMLFYNSQTPLGLKLGKYLWKYHVLKHLPVCETIEFHKLYPSFSATEKAETDRIYSLLLKTTKNIIREYSNNGNDIRQTVDNHHFSFHFICDKSDKGGGTCQVNLIVKEKNSGICYNEPHLSKFSPKEWSELFQNMLIILNTFSEYTSFSCQSHFINHKSRIHLFNFTLISYKKQ